MAGYQSQANEDVAQLAGNVNGSDDKTQDARPSPAEELAASIFQFVQIAGSLGSTLSSVSAEQEAEDFTSRRSDSNQKPADADENNTMPADESQIQLLRLRVKHREIIVFPILSTSVVSCSELESRQELMADNPGHTSQSRTMLLPILNPELDEPIRTNPICSSRLFPGSRALYPCLRMGMSVWTSWGR